MSSGVVEYKLCDKDFDCDNCPFDKALWQKSRATTAGTANTGIMAKLQDSISDDENRNECLFLGNHLVLRKLYKNSYFIGFSKFFRHCLAPLSDVRVEAVKGFVPMHTPAFRVTRGSQAWNITLPFDAQMLASMSDQLHNPQNGEWLGLFEAEEQEVEFASQTPAHFKKNSAASLKLISKEITGSEAGVTMFDGGAMVETLAELLGPQKFEKVIADICNFSNMG